MDENRVLKWTREIKRKGLVFLKVLSPHLVWQREACPMAQAKEISSVDTRTGKVAGEFPGGPVVRTWHFDCGGPEFNPWSGS